MKSSSGVDERSQRRRLGCVGSGSVLRTGPADRQHAFKHGRLNIGLLKKENNQLSCSDSRNKRNQTKRYRAFDGVAGRRLCRGVVKQRISKSTNLDA